MPNLLKFGSLNVLEPSRPVQACNGIALPLPLPLPLPLSIPLLIPIYLPLPFPLTVPLTLLLPLPFTIHAINITNPT